MLDTLTRKLTAYFEQNPDIVKRDAMDAAVDRVVEEVTRAKNRLKLPAGFYRSPPT